MEVYEVQALDRRKFNRINASTIARSKRTAFMSDKEWFDAGNCKVAEIPFAHDATKDTIGNINDSQGNETPEASLWSHWISETITDASGIGQYANEICNECHMDQIGCGCHTMELPRKTIRKYNDTFAWIKHPQWNKGMRKVPVDHIVVVKGKAYWRKLSMKCPNAHTYQQCAQRKIDRWEFAQVCASLNLDAEYVRKRIKQGSHDLDRDRRRGVYEKARISA
jgi:hypothetical protein